MESEKDIQTLLRFKFVKLDKKGQLYILSMSHKMNIFSFDFLTELKQALHYLAQKTQGPACLITVSEIPKTFSAGLDLKVLLNQKQKRRSQLLVRSYIEVISMILSLPMITIAAINGHAYAGGLVFALAHDFRLMNQDFGNLCMSEIKHGIPLSPPFNIVCEKRLPMPHFQKIVLTGDPYTPQQGYEAKFIDQLCPLSELQKKAEEMGSKMTVPVSTISEINQAEHRQALKEIKYEMNKEMLEVLRVSHEKITQGGPKL